MKFQDWQNFCVQISLCVCRFRYAYIDFVMRMKRNSFQRSCETTYIVILFSQWDSNSFSCSDDRWIIALPMTDSSVPGHWCELQVTHTSCKNHVSRSFFVLDFGRLDLVLWFLAEYRSHVDISILDQLKLWFSFRKSDASTKKIARWTHTCILTSRHESTKERRTAHECQIPILLGVGSCSCEGAFTIGLVIHMAWILLQGVFRPVFPDKEKGGQYDWRSMLAKYVTFTF